MSDPHMTRIWRQRAIALGGGLLFLAAPYVFFGPRQPDMSHGLRLLGWTGCITLGVIWVFAFGVRTFAGADEYLRDVDKTAWLWGGIGGLAISAPVFVFVTLGGLHWLDPARPFGPELGRAFALGYGLLVFSQLFGYLAVAAWRRWSRR
jgi:hypothetical protein